MRRLALIALCSFLVITLQAQHKYFLLVGTYTSNTKSEGIYLYSFDPGTGSCQQVGNAATINDPSYLALSNDEKYVFAVNETSNDQGSGGTVTSFRFNKASGELTQINRQPSGGDHPCYIAVHPSGRWIAVANYTSGSLAILPVEKDGSLGKPVVTMKHQGSGPNKERQDKPHVHSTVFSPDGKFLYVADLGIDKEMIYAFNAENGLLSNAPFPSMSVKPGSGPRHFIFHPNSKFAYLVEEMGGTVSAYKLSNGKLTFMQRLSTLPPNFKKPNTSADVHISPDGQFLYASNRGEANSIAIYKIDKVSGKLTTVGFQSTMGKTPRNFNLDPPGNFLLVANQQSDEIVIFRRNKRTGKLTDTGKRISVPAPVCLKWATAE